MLFRSRSGTSEVPQLADFIGKLVDIPADRLPRFRLLGHARSIGSTGWKPGPTRAARKDQSPGDAWLDFHQHREGRPRRDAGNNELGVVFSLGLQLTGFGKNSRLGATFVVRLPEPRAGPLWKQPVDQSPVKPPTKAAGKGLRVFRLAEAKHHEVAR